MNISDIPEINGAQERFVHADGTIKGWPDDELPDSSPVFILSLPDGTEAVLDESTTRWIATQWLKRKLDIR